MKYLQKLISPILILAACAAQDASAQTDTISNAPVWHVSALASPSYVFGTCTFLQGENTKGKTINCALSGSLRAGFSFSQQSRPGRLYPGMYQGIGLESYTLFAPSLLGSPVAAHIYQGTPVFHFSNRLWLGYEWKFGAAFGWKHHKKDSDDNNSAVSTNITAQMGIALRLNYSVTPCWHLSLAIEGVHFSNGNTSSPNSGVNMAAATIGLTYIINPHPTISSSPQPDADADRPGWHYDIMAYGARRKRILTISGQSELCPGSFGVGGLQFAVMRKFNRWFSAGPAVDLQYDESAGLPPYHVEGTTGDYLKFYRPPFGKQLSAGLSAHAELTAAIFAINGGIGYDLLCPKGNEAFYQSLSLKAFITPRLFLNVGYRLGNFKESQNLMLGAGVRL